MRAFLFTLLFSSATWAAPTAFVYEGYLAQGGTGYTGTVDASIRILSGACHLYSETFNGLQVDGGYFNLNITGTAGTLGPGSFDTAPASFENIFRPHSFCGTPTSSTTPRSLEITIDGEVFGTLALNSAPFAISASFAEKSNSTSALQGRLVSDAIPANGNVLTYNAGVWAPAAVPASGTVTSVAAGAGLTGGPITSTGTLSLANSGVTAGTYKSVTVDTYGRVTAGVAALVAGDIPDLSASYLTPSSLSATIPLAWNSGTRAMSLSLPVCTAGQVLNSDGTNFSCVTDNSGAAAGDAGYGAGSKGVIAFDTNAATSGITVNSGVARINASTAAGTHGSTTQIPVITVDGFGRVTGVTAAAISVTPSAISGGTSNSVAIFDGTGGLTGEAILAQTRGGLGVDATSISNNSIVSKNNSGIFTGFTCALGETISFTAGIPTCITPIQTGGSAGGDLTGAYPNPTVANSSISNAKIQDDAITSAKISDFSITNIDINAAAGITDGKLATISAAGKVSGNAITSGTIGGATIISTTGAISGGSLTASDLPAASFVQTNAGGTLQAATSAKIVGSSSGFGPNALLTGLGNSNTAIGSSALRSTAVGGSSNTVVGADAGYSISTSQNNVAVGHQSLRMLSSSPGRDNVAVGQSALYYLTGAYNVAVGTSALSSVSAGNNNTVIGHMAGNSVTGVSSGNIFIGSGAGATGTVNDTLIISNHSNESTSLLFGKMFDSNTLNSNKIGIGMEPTIHSLEVNGGGYFAGNVGIGIPSPGYMLHVNGQVAGNGTFVNLSDERLKKNIRVIENSLEKISSIEGVSYKWKTEENPHLNLSSESELGIIAQNVEKVFPEAISEDEEGIKRVAYSMLIAPLIEAVKELKLLYDKLVGVQTEQASKIQALESENRELKQRLDLIEQRLAQ